jgi:hypothetical protein
VSFAHDHAALSPEVRELYAHYGHAMHRVQNVEMLIRGLFQLTLPEAERSIENIEAHVADLFRRPLGKMPLRLGLDSDLTEVLRIAVELRNKMAHEVPFMATVRVNTGATTLAD